MTRPDRLPPEVVLLLEVGSRLVALSLRSLAAVEGLVNLQQFRALRLLAERGPCRAGALASGLALHPSSGTRLVDRLVAAGLVTRDVRLDNRRVVELDITLAGRRVVDAVLDETTGELQAVLSRLSPPAAQQLRDVLPALVSAQHAVDRDHGASPG